MKTILKLTRHNSKKEIEFELRYLMSLPVSERFKMMFKKSREMLNLLNKNGYRKSFEVIKRT